MTMVLILLLSLICIVFGDNSYYTAASLEYAPLDVPSNMTLTRSEALSIMSDNIANYELYIQQAKALGANIIVLPEYGLLGWPDIGWNRTTIFPFMESIPDPSSSSSPLNPCLSSSIYSSSAPMTVGLSCLARNYNIAVVANYGDLLICSPGVDGCRDDGRLQFNTAVAFNEDGDLLVRYHKRHLYFEQEWYDVDSDGGHEANFTTNFGVTFGLFICFDIFWENTETLTDFVYPTYWDNDHMVNATVVQTIWSSAHHVNFIAGNIGTDRSSSGSGIYTQGVPLAEWNNDSYQPISKLLVANVPILSKKH